MKKGFVNVTTGVYLGISLFHCVADGNIIITWEDHSTDIIPCLSGDDFTILGATQVEVSTGTFHIS